MFAILQFAAEYPVPPSASEKHFALTTSLNNSTIGIRLPAGVNRRDNSRHDRIAATIQRVS